MTEKNETQVPAVRDAGIVPSMFSTGGEMYSSLDRSNRQNAALILRCMNACEKKIADEIGSTIMTAHLFAHEVHFLDDNTGELKSATRVVLIDTDNVAHECVSIGISKSIGALLQLFGMPPWVPALPLIPRQRSLSGGHRFFYLDIDEKKIAKGK